MSNLKVTIGYHNNNPFINIYKDKIRYRYWNGKAIDLKIKAKENPTLLKAAFELKLREGWRPSTKTNKAKEKPTTVVQAITKAIETKIVQGCSERYIKDAKRVLVLWKRYENERQIKNLKVDDLKASHIKTFLIRANWSAKTQRTVKSTLSPLLNDYKPNLVSKVVLKKPTSTLHKPFNNIKEILDEVKLFNSNLYLCCLMTYGCLLRPHREIRELTWKDFSDDCKFYSFVW